ncbi:type II toxin-antitoxin system HicB family antitoxin [Turneriella parva]|uniref:HicB family protein n=1 Tax=Turneriella parva (strain ATCC BAA-1111 / DSM 21527 / NCTC 11395 / H) TaxID=869212 RepID=I4B4A4_TURPD|nr:toxin-antitoxin system HicB family antitoxin [Turneriella parva]AFM12111.1 HicB family protein [Turneriella parva DSM 21527]
MRTEAKQYTRLIQWSDEDKCFIGECPELLVGGVHGKDEIAVHKALTQVIDEAIEILDKDGRKLPDAIIKHKYSGQFVLRAGETLHKNLAIRAFKSGKSLNEFCIERLSQ